MTDLASIVSGGTLRAAINTGNRALVQETEAGLEGVSPALARRLADRLGVRLEAVVYRGAGAVFEDADKDRWDVAFLAVDPIRARKVSFTRPYHIIEATYAARAGSRFTDTASADSPDVTIVASTGSAYELYLRAALRHATLLPAANPGESFDTFRRGSGDLVAGVRASLERHFGHEPEFRVLDDVLTRVEQAMVLPGADHPAIGHLDRFVAEAVEDGFVASHIVGS